MSFFIYLIFVEARIKQCYYYTDIVKMTYKMYKINCIAIFLFIRVSKCRTLHPLPQQSYSKAKEFYLYFL